MPLGIFLDQIVIHAAFRAKDDILLTVLQRIVNDRAGRADHIRMLQGIRRAFGMHGKLCIRMLSLGAQNVLLRDAVMYRAAAIPEDDLFFRTLPADPGAQIFIRDKQDFSPGQRADDFDCARGRDAHIALRLERSGCVDIGNDRNVWIFRAEGAHPLGRNLLRHRTGGALFWQNDGFIRRKDFDRFRHKAHATDNNPLILVGGGGFGKGVAIAAYVGSREDFWSLIGVRED